MPARRNAKSTNRSVPTTGNKPLDDYAPAFFALIATRLTERIIEEGGRVAASRGIKTPARCMSTMVTLLEGPVGVTELARSLGFTHVAVIKNVNRLKELGLVKTGRDPNDARRKPVSLTPAGERAARDVRRFIDILQSVYDEAFAEIGVDAYDALVRLQAALEQRSFYDRLDEAIPPPAAFDGS